MQKKNLDSISKKSIDISAAYFELKPLYKGKERKINVGTFSANLA